MHPRTTSVLAYRPILAALAAHGVDVAAFVQKLGLTAEVFEDDEQRVEISKADPMWDKAAALLDDPLFGLHLASHLKVETFGVFTYLAATSDTVGIALRRVCEFFRLVGDGVRYDLIESDEESGHAVMVMTVLSAHAASRHIVEFSLAAAYAYTIVTAGDRFSASSVSFEHAANADLSEYTRFFGIEPKFAAERNAFSFDRNLLAAPLQSSDPHLANLLERYARTLLADLPSAEPFFEQARHELLQLLRKGEASLEALAEALQMRPRTLQHQLQEQGTSFSTLLDELRCGLAKEFVKQPHFGLAEIAYIVGFSDQSSFNRAFRRWTGQSPGRYRRGEEADG